MSTRVFFLPLLTLLISPINTVPAASYQISVAPRVVNGNLVRLNIATNIPGTIEVMANVTLAGLKSSDIWIGKNDRVKVVNGKGVAELDASKLPKGKYIAEVSFYPRWGFADDKSRATNITHEISARAHLSLQGSGKSAASVKQQKEQRKWVMNNVYTGYPWNLGRWITRFGNPEELKVTRGNPRIIKAYYFGDIDMTVLVNVMKSSVVTWRLGRKTE